jgi:hypothetical protein
MVADPVKSLDYFGAKWADEGAGEDDVAPGVKGAASAAELEEAIKAKGKLVLDFYAPW